jgi:hypothetical protein
VRKAIWILWPSFIVAGVAEVVFFSVFDPLELHMLAKIVGMESRLAWYTIGFVMFWAFAAASSAFTCFLQRTAEEINRCPLPPVHRPVGCPKREDPNAAC